MNLDVHTLPEIELIRRGKLSIFYMGFRPDGSRGEWWKAYRSGSVEGQGETIREAIIDLYKKLT